MGLITKFVLLLEVSFGLQERPQEEGSHEKQEMDFYSLSVPAAWAASVAVRDGADLIHDGI